MIFKTKEDIDAARFLISPPGDTLNETIESKNISQAELASRMGRPVKTINEIIQAKASITPETALQLERVLSISAEFWMQREQNYRLELAEIAEAEYLLNTKEWVNNFPLLKMKQLCWVDYQNNDVVEQSKALLNFFAVSNREAYYKHYNFENQRVAARMSENSLKSPYSINAWLRRGEIQASYLQASEYSEETFKEVLNEIKTLMANHPANFFEQLQSLCLSAGVKVVHTPCLPKTKLHGSTRWLNKIPLIQLSNQYQRNDIFWFTFFHEAGHFLLHGKKDVFIEGLEYTEDDKLKEEEADRFAMKYTFSDKEEMQLLSEINQVGDQVAYIHNFAQRINTHTALIIGRLAKKNLLHDSIGWSYNFYKKIDLTTIHNDQQQ